MNAHMNKSTVWKIMLAAVSAGIYVTGHVCIKRKALHKSSGETAKPAVLILVNHDLVVYNFRLELVERLLEEGYEVHISSPYGERIDALKALGIRYHEISMERHGMNPIAEIRILKEYFRLMHTVKPLAVLGYTIKPNIYGAFTAKFVHVPFIANITGLGTAMGNGGISQRVMAMLYRAAFTKVRRVFFQNQEDEKVFSAYQIANDRHSLLPGSGVNLQRYPVTTLPECGDGKTGSPVQFAFISRIMKEKGIEQYLAAAKVVKRHFPETEFHVCGFCEDEYKGRLGAMTADGTVKYHGMIRDVSGFIASMHCIVHPTYYPEGLSNVILESCSSGRAVITTDRTGCREAVENGKNGYLVPEKNTAELVKAVERFIKLSYKEKAAMGLEGRKMTEQKFSRQIVVGKYMDEIYEVQAVSVQKGKVCAGLTDLLD